MKNVNVAVTGDGTLTVTEFVRDEELDSFGEGPVPYIAHRKDFTALKDFFDFVRRFKEIMM